MQRYLLKFQKYLKLSILLFLTLLIPKTCIASEKSTPKIPATSEVSFNDDKIKTQNTTKKDITVDYALSVGGWCICAKHLRDNKLRKVTSPIDWMQTPSLDNVAHLFETRFEDFFENVNVTEEKRDNGNRTVYDTKNNIKSIHYMPSKIPFKKAHSQFKRKMKKRAKELHKTLSKSKSVLLLNCREYPGKYGKNSTDKELKRFAKKFSKIYPNLEKIYLIDIHNDNKEKIRKRVIEKTDKIEIIQYKFKNIDNKKFMPPFGNNKAWNRILKNVKLTSGNIQETQ